MMTVAATPFASLFVLFVAVPLSLIVCIYLGEGLVSLRDRRARSRPSRSASVVERSPEPLGIDTALNVG